jgi:hypothetical protein
MVHLIDEKFTIVARKLTMFAKGIQTDFTFQNGNLQKGNMIVRHMNLLVLFEH